MFAYYYTVCYFTCIFYAVVSQISILFIDNKDSVFCILYKTTAAVKFAGSPRVTEHFLRSGKVSRHGQNGYRFITLVQQSQEDQITTHTSTKVTPRAW